MNFWTYNFKKGIALSFVFAIILLLCSYIYGNNEFFLMVNGDLGKVADNFFAYYTYLGDGACWIIWLVLFIIYKRKDILFLVLGFVYTTIVTQVFKYIIIPEQPRPMSVIANKALVHTVEGVDIHLISSFPSGHSTTAFTFYLFACIIFNNKWVTYLAIIPAILVGYSRIYLAQHFPRDVAGGIIIAILCAILTVITYQYIQRKRGDAERITLNA